MSLEKLSNLMDLHEGRIHNLEVQLDNSAQELSTLTTHNEKLGSGIAQLQDEFNVLEQYSRRNCIRVFGLSESAGENTNELVRKLAHDRLGSK